MQSHIKEESSESEEGNCSFENSIKSQKLSGSPKIETITAETDPKN